MMKRPTVVSSVSAAVLLVIGVTAIVVGQQRGGLSPQQTQRRWDLENELQSIAVVDRKVMMPMRDGVRLATDIYRPKDASKKVGTIFVRTPYNFNLWEVRNGLTSDLTTAHTAVETSYE